MSEIGEIEEPTWGESEVAEPSLEEPASRRRPLNMNRRADSNPELTNAGIGRGQGNNQVRAIAEHRRTLVSDLILQGFTHAQISDQLKISRSTVTQDAGILRRRWREQQLRSVEDLVAMEAAKLDRREQTFAPLAWSGSIDSDKQLNQIAVRRAKLLGLDAAAKTDVTLKTAEEQSLENKLEWMATNIRAGEAPLTGWQPGDPSAPSEDATAETSEDVD